MSDRHVEFKYLLLDNTVSVTDIGFEVADVKVIMRTVPENSKFYELHMLL